MDLAEACVAQIQRLLLGFALRCQQVAVLASKKSLSPDWSTVLTIGHAKAQKTEAFTLVASPA
ncbi:MAG: hypothetical protein ACKO8I_11410 [Cyanobacteriota bacterium]